MVIASSGSQSPPRWMEVAGWAGMAMILGAFAASSYELGVDKRWLAMANALGASGVGLLCWRQQAWPAMFLEIAWAFVALTSLLGLSPAQGLPVAGAATLLLGGLILRANRGQNSKRGQNKNPAAVKRRGEIEA
jgi:hypothetical protein